LSENTFLFDRQFVLLSIHASQLDVLHLQINSQLFHNYLSIYLVP